MTLTSEQRAIIASVGDIKIDAVAGSGKTTTLMEYARSRPIDSRILYIAFNKSVKLEARTKFENAGLRNVTIETAHSLAYKRIVNGRNYELRNGGYRTSELQEILDIKGDGERHSEYIVANHVKRCFSYFCNSDAMDFSSINYLDTVKEKKAISFVSLHLGTIHSKAEELWNAMEIKKIEITHDFYLKLFHLSNPVLKYDYILFDEGQDASPVMLDIFKNQRATKVIAGDVFQQIYSWRWAVNSLAKTEFREYRLSQSFRFSQEIADLAVAILNWKRYIEQQSDTLIFGHGKNTQTSTKAILGRTNLGLLVAAIEYIEQNPSIKRVYFEGNISSYTYAEDGASLYDVLNLKTGKVHLVKDKIVKTMNTIDELEDYVDKTEDVQLGTIIEIVKKYGSKIVDILNEIRNMHVPDENRKTAQVIFSTIHRSKGLEYDTVQLVEDFIDEDRIRDQISINSDTDKLNEEINLLYVAITRTKNNLLIPETLLPKGFPMTQHVFRIPGKRRMTDIKD